MTVARPGVAISAAGTTAVRVLALPLAFSVPTVVARALPFHWATVLATKGPPKKVMVRSEVPALMTEGEMELRLAPVFP